MQEAKKYIFNQNEGSSPSANILITGEIDEFWGTGLRSLADEITQSKAENIMLQINSPGGSVTEGQAIAAFIKGYPAKIDTSGVGLVASIATTILLAGDVVTMDKNSYFMIHNPWANALGEAEELRHTANLLDEMKNQLINVYVDAIQKNKKLINGRRKETAKQVALWMEQETWFTASEALEAGFIQGLTNGAEFLNKETAKNIYNSCSKFKNVPVEFLNKVKIISQENGTSLGNFLNNLINEMATEEISRSEIIKQIASSAGISENTVSQILSGNINCPPLNRLEGFAEVLETSIDSIVAAAENDSCSYVLDKTNNKMKTEKETVESGFFNHIKSFFNKGKSQEVEVIEEEKKEVIEKEDEDEKEEMTKEEMIEAAKKLLIEEGILQAVKEPVAKEEIEVSNSNLEKQLEAMQNKIELQAKQLQQIKEEKEGSPTATDCFAETSNTKKTNIQLLMSKKENKAFFDGIAQILK